MATTGICFDEDAQTTAKRACCGLDADGIVWYGSNPTMTFEELAKYCGPICQDRLILSSDHRNKMSPKQRSAPLLWGS
jgi:hypothetical protein